MKCHRRLITVDVRCFWFQALLSRLNAMRLTVSNRRFLKIMDKYAATFDEILAKEQEKGNEMLKKKSNPVQGALAVATHSDEQEHDETLTPINVETTVPLSSDVQQVSCDAELPSCDKTSSHVDSPENMQFTVGPVTHLNGPPVDEHCSLTDAAAIDPTNGFNVVVDNWDMRQEVRHMTSDHQNTDIHWVNHNIVENRVSGNHLPDDKPVKDVMEVENKDLIPSFADHKELYNNYLVHIQRILTKRIPALQCLSDHVSKHIRHKHTQEMSKKSKKVMPHKHNF